jgi:hypothetical protein
VFECGSFPGVISTALAKSRDRGVLQAKFENIVSSKLFKALAGIGGLVAFISSLVTILQGWPAVKELIDVLKSKTQHRAGSYFIFSSTHPCPHSLQRNAYHDNLIQQRIYSPEMA